MDTMMDVVDYMDLNLTGEMFEGWWHEGTESASWSDLHHEHRSTPPCHYKASRTVVGDFKEPILWSNIYGDSIVARIDSARQKLQVEESPSVALPAEKQWKIPIAGNIETATQKAKAKRKRRKDRTTQKQLDAAIVEQIKSTIANAEGRWKEVALRFQYDWCRQYMPKVITKIFPADIIAVLEKEMT